LTLVAAPSDRFFVRRSSIHPGSTTSGRLWAASHPDILRSQQAYSPYLCIPPVFDRPCNDK
jgi:hypothetical protein